MAKLFPQTTIAVIWDFDKTLAPGYMQRPLFEHFGVDGADFWQEVEGLADFYRRSGVGMVEDDTLYLEHILTYVRQGEFAGLSNRMLRDLGADIEFYPGIPAFFDELRKYVEAEPRFAEHGIAVEHYVVSTGLRQMIMGSRIAGHVDGVWGCEFADTIPMPGYLENRQQELFDPSEADRQIAQVVYALGYTTKTRALFEINKGSNVNENIDVNSKLDEEDRRIPFQNMIYIADGPSDIPTFAVVRQQGGRAYGVYRPESRAEFEQAAGLLEQGRIHAFGEANYEPGTQSHLWIRHAVEQIAQRIVNDRSVAIEDRLGPPPGHID
ncbi:MAG: haloacid dehalogenase-like hydrolase [Acidimicrobiia bacterium]|nr:haloacid dehalogenase-like hydrolase [Acidimicrobiia bacterium]